MFVQTACRAVPRVVNRVRHALARAHPTFKTVEAASVGVLPGRDPHDTLKGALEVKRADTERCAQCRQRRLTLAMVAVQHRAHTIHERVIGRDVDAIGVATAAGTISRMACRFWDREELHPLPAWPPRRATWTAIDARAAHGVHEYAVLHRVVGEHRLPTPVVVPSSRSGQFHCCNPVVRGCMCNGHSRPLFSHRRVHSPQPAPVAPPDDAIVICGSDRHYRVAPPCSHRSRNGQKGPSGSCGQSGAIPCSPGKQEEASRTARKAASLDQPPITANFVNANVAASLSPATVPKP